MTKMISKDDSQDPQASEENKAAGAVKISATSQDDRYDALAEQLDSCINEPIGCLLYTSPSPRDQRGSRMPSSA